MTTLTDKELIKEIKECIGSLDVRDNIERRAYEIALASLEAEPVAKIIAHYPLGIDVGKQKFVQAIGELPDFGGHLFAAPPVPVVPEEKPMPNPLSMYAVDAVAAIAEVRGWNACRAAMLHGAEPASNHEELPLDYLQGQKDGLEWAAQLAEANHPQTGDWLYDDPLELAKAIRKGPDMPEFDGPTPVTLDGWISCSERMPENIPGSCKEYLVFDGLNNKVHHDYWVVPDGDSAPVASFWNHYGAHVTHWMPLPEPPKEVNRG
ncbi:TPA: DUF551 domain-containing protein [Escherichia coli]|nr:DUF551 domain-containing protein [Escherichia coli]HEE9700181.1 DUF551 domain-containing protein [Escherichia coli]